MAYLHLEVQHPYGEVSQYMLKVNNKKDALPSEFIPIIAKKYLRGSVKIRVFYTSPMTNGACRLQLAGLLWRANGKICWGSTDQRLYSVYSTKFEYLGNNWEQYNEQRKREYLASQRRH